MEEQTNYVESMTAVMRRIELFDKELEKLGCKIINIERMSPCSAVITVDFNCKDKDQST